MLRPTLIAVSLCLVTYGVWSLMRWGLGGVLSEAARTVGTPAYEALAVVDRDRTDLLVRNALDRDPAVASPARVAINTLIDRWMIEASSAADYSEHSKLVRERLITVQSQLLAGLPRLTPSGVSWAEQLGAHMIRVAERLPLSDRMAVVDGTSQLLDQVAAATLQTDALEPRRLEPEAPEQVSEKDDTPAEPRWFTIPKSLRDGLAEEPAPVTQPMEVKPIAPVSPDWQPDWQLTEQPTKSQPAPIEATPAQVADPNAPMTVRDLIAELIELEAERERLAKLHKEPEALGPTTRRETPEYDPRLLVIQEELRRRGYSTLRADHAQLFVSTKASDRRVLAERLAAEGGGDSLKLALELARDEDATVRLAALRTLSASPYQAIVREAFRIAVADPDPRVASLSGELRSRL